MGHIGGSLSEKGIKQAKMLAIRLKEEKIDHAYCSDLERCKLTLDELLKLNSIPTTYDMDLREKTGGIYDGVEKHIYEEEIYRSGISKYKFRPKRGENMFDLKDRVERFYNKLLRNHNNDETILISTSGNWIRIFIIVILLKTPLNQALYTLRIKNTSVSKIYFDKNLNYEIDVINCTKHLDQDLESISRN